MKLKIVINNTCHNTNCLIMTTPPPTPVDNNKYLGANALVIRDAINTHEYDECFNAIVNKSTILLSLETTKPPPNSPEGQAVLHLSPKEYVLFLQDAKKTSRIL